MPGFDDFLTLTPPDFTAIGDSWGVSDSGDNMNVALVPDSFPSVSGGDIFGGFLDFDKDAFNASPTGSVGGGIQNPLASGNPRFGTTIQDVAPAAQTAAQVPALSFASGIINSLANLTSSALGHGTFRGSSNDSVSAGTGADFDLGGTLRGALPFLLIVGVVLILFHLLKKL